MIPQTGGFNPGRAMGQPNAQSPGSMPMTPPRVQGMPARFNPGQAMGLPSAQNPGSAGSGLGRFGGSPTSGAPQLTAGAMAPGGSLSTAGGTQGGVAAPSLQPLTTSQAGSAPSAPGAPIGGYGQTAGINPQSDLRSETILPGQESNRFDLANKALQTYQQQQLPQFQADLRNTIQNRGAALGRLGSGMLRTDVGNLDLAQQRDSNAMGSNLLNNALGNQITDNANQRNEARGERDYENGLENQGYNRGVQGLELQDQLTNSAFGRAQGQEQTGYQQNPADYQMLLSGMYGQQAGQAGNALSGLIQNQTMANAIGQQGQIPPWLQSILGGQGGVEETPVPQIPTGQLPGVGTIGG